jgi:hypothetical protein
LARPNKPMKLPADQWTARLRRGTIDFGRSLSAQRWVDDFMVDF